jgi:signal transduction histidine kinase
LIWTSFKLIKAAMLRTINQKFYTIAGLLIFLFFLAYVEVAFFLNQQSKAAEHSKQAVQIERQIHNLLILFNKMRFWERAVFSQDFPDAEKQFGKTMTFIKSELNDVKGMVFDPRISKRLKKVTEILAEYENYFNQLVQIKTEHRLKKTLIYSNYQSLASFIHHSNNPSLLKPLFILLDFQTLYSNSNRDSGYQAIQVVLDSLEIKSFKEGLLDDRLQSYLKSYRKVLREDYSIQEQFESMNTLFNQTSARLTNLLTGISMEAETLLKNTFIKAEFIGKRLKYIFFLSSSMGLMVLLLILLIVMRKIVRPVRSVAAVINDIKSGDTSSRFVFKGYKHDEINQLGLIFNDMLETLEDKNRQLLDYQAELESKLTELSDRQAERDALIEELEAKNEELEKFTYTVSHDLKSPLITIKGFAGFLEEDATSGDTERIKSDISRISEAAGKMQMLLDDLLELSRIGRMTNPPEEVSFKDIVSEALDMVAGQINDKNVKIKIDESLPKIYGDRKRLCDAIQNLLDNAVKYMGPQANPTIKIGYRRSGEEDFFFIEDNGIGIDPKYQEKVFGLFEKLEMSVEGSGVGLAIVKRIIEIHGGRIWVESEGPTHGSTFCFTLPNKFG